MEKNKRQWVDLGNQFAACITHPENCTNGGTVSAWFYCKVTAGDVNFMTTLATSRTGFLFHNG